MQSLDATAIRCQVGWFVSPEGEATRALCQKLSCPTCAPRKLRRYRARLARQPWARLLTLTLPPNYGSLADGIAAQARGWRVVSQWLRRNYALKEYAWCREVTNVSAPRAHLHMHAIVNSKYIHTKRSKYRVGRRTLDDVARSAGFGYVDVRKVSSVGGSSGYVTKYISKCTAWLPRYTRRFQSNVPNLPKLSSGWHFLRDWQYSQDDLLGVCTHGNRRSGCNLCSEECARVDDARRKAAIGVNLRLNLIPSKKNCFSGHLPRPLEVAQGPPLPLH